MVFVLRATALFLFLYLLPLTGSAQNDAVVYGGLGDRSTPASWTLQIAFWRDPDLAEVASRKREDNLNEKLTQFGERLKNEIGEELHAAGFGDFTITLIEDYDRLKDERFKRDGFHLLHCDPAMYLLGKAFLESHHEEDPYQVLLEEASQENRGSSGAAVWVRKDSSLRDLQDLSRRHVVITNRFSLMGGALQRAKLLRDLTPPLREGLTEGSGDYEVTTCGSDSDALLRLATGLATESPIEAAFLPLEGPGFRLVMRDLGMKSMEELPFRVLSSASTDSFPCFPLLVNTFFSRQHPAICANLKRLLLSERRERLPYHWREVNPEAMKRLAQDLAPLTSIESTSP